MIEHKEYDIVMTTLEPIRIGGIASHLSGIDNPIAIVGNKPAVPGSTLKGAYRYELERHLIDTYYDRQTKQWKDKKLQPCIPSTKLSQDEYQLVQSGYYRFNNQFQQRGDIKGDGCHYPCTEKKCKIEHEICPVCYFLGSNGLEGFIKVPFLFANAAIDELYSANIDRATQTVKQGTNRPYQLVPNGTIFTGKMDVLIKDTIRDKELGKARNLKDFTSGDSWLKGNPRTTEAVIQEFVIERLESIKTIGGYKSKGFGNVKIKVSNTKSV